MPTASPRLDHWPSIVSHVSSLVDLEASARSHRALLRKRGVRSAADLLHLALLYGPGGLSLRGVASFATDAGIADLCDVSLLGRSAQRRRLPGRRAGASVGTRPWRRTDDGRLQLSLVDGSAISLPGSDGSDWRLHARYEPAHGRFTDLAMTEAATAEALCCAAVRPGDLLVQDRGYARVRNFAHARSNGADFITRIGWRSVRLCDVSGQSFDLLAALPESSAPVVEHQVRIGSWPQRRAGAADHRPQAAGGNRAPTARLRRKASRKGHKTDPRTLRTAGFMMLLTSLPSRACDRRRSGPALPHALAGRACLQAAEELGRVCRSAGQRPKACPGVVAGPPHRRCPHRDFAGRGSRRPPLRRTLLAPHGIPACGGSGRWHTGNCNAPSLPDVADASARSTGCAQPSCPSPSHPDEGHHKQGTPKGPYPSADGAEPLGGSRAKPWPLLRFRLEQAPHRGGSKNGRCHPRR